VDTLSSEHRSIGQGMRWIVAAEKLDAALDAIRKSNARLLSVNALRGNLEDYFLEHVGEAPPPPGENA
jgi:hypothetical protein